MLSQLEPGQIVDRYRVEGVLGRGGVATVYAVRHQRLGSLHALKVISVTTSAFRKRLLQEGRGQAGLRHPNVVSVFDVLEVNGAPALLMEYVGGPTLGHFLRKGKYTLDQALWLFRGVVLGVSAAHRRGLVHRDLKPENVLLAPTNDGFVPKVTDFGLVKMLKQTDGVTQMGAAVGTAPYMAPEQIVDAADADERVDLWALGCILYEIVAGRRPFQGNDTLDTFNRIRMGNYKPLREAAPDAPERVLLAVDKLLQIDRDHRMSNCDELFELLFDNAAPAPVDVQGLEGADEHDPVVITRENTAPTDVVRTASPPRTMDAPIAPLALVDTAAHPVPAPVAVSTSNVPEAPEPQGDQESPIERRAALGIGVLSIALALGLFALAALALRSAPVDSRTASISSYPGVGDVP